MRTERPNPDELLARLKADEVVARRGRLRIFFGYAAGVGKTFAMLEAARREKAEGVDIVVGYVEPHGRAETEALLEGLEVLPSIQVPYRGVTLREFDLDASLKRHPRLVLVDELAHTNAEGCRHAKRWQDVEELLKAGIDVWTTLNVQHIESINDVVAQITGVTVRETLPDAVLERADEIELVDLTPEELMDRLKEGKVYLPQQAERALQQFFRKSNLVALRELALRQAAHRLRRDVDAARHERAAVVPWAANERLLVCVGPSPTTAKLIRTAKRMADALGAEWLAVVVETRGEDQIPTPVRQQVAQHLRLAESLGAETHTLIGRDVAATILDYAGSRNVTKIVVGKTAQPRWKRALFASVVDDLLEKSGDIDVYVIKGESEGPAIKRTAPPATQRSLDSRAYLATAGVVVISGLLAWAVWRLSAAEANTVMVFLLGVAYVATRYGRGPAIAAAIANVLVFDFFFVEPYYSFDVSDARYLFTFAVMLGIGLLISELTAQVRERLRASQRQEQRTAALYRLTRQLSEVAGTEFLIRTAGRQLDEIFGGEVVLFIREANADLKLRYGEETSVGREPINTVVAQWVTDHDQIAGTGTDTLPNATALFIPLIGSQRTIGALGIRPEDAQRLADPEQRRLLETCASLIALSIERDQSLLEANRAQLQFQTEQLRSSLLSSVSHDLRTPLAAIAGAGTSLLETPASADSEMRRELLQGIVDESRRLSRLVDNLLDMTRLTSGPLEMNRQWHVLEEVIGSALSRVRRELERHLVVIDLPADLPLLSLDGVLMEQVFVNLLENAVHYTPAGSRVDVRARRLGDRVEITIADNGPGLPVGAETRVFEKFFRGAITPDGRRGVGLGLAICKAIVEVHGGRISARNQPGGGAEFTITLPCAQGAPEVSLDEAAMGSSA